METMNHFTDLYSAEKYAKFYDAVISLGHFLPEKFRQDKKYLFLNFGDENFASVNADPNNLKYAPKEQHVRQIIDFIRNLKPTDKLLVHCFAGYSRSPAAVAIARCERDGLTLNKALENLKHYRIPDEVVPWPNDIILHEYLMIK